MGKSIIKEKSFAVAVRMVNLSRFLQQEKKEFILSKQILRSGTSIGANVRESLQAESRADFIHKLSIANKETHETLYWLELLKACNIIEENHFNSIYPETVEVSKILSSIIITTKQKKG